MCPKTENRRTDPMARCVDQAFAGDIIRKSTPVVSKIPVIDSRLSNINEAMPSDRAIIQGQGNSVDTVATVIVVVTGVFVAVGVSGVTPVTVSVVVFAGDA